MAQFLPEKWDSEFLKVKLHLPFLLGLILCWSYGIVAAQFWNGDKGLQVYVFSLMILGFVIYRNRFVQIRLTFQHLTLFLVFLLILVASHGPFLFYSLGGDELWHAEKASVLLVKVNQWDVARGGNRFLGIQAIDLSRILGFLFLGLSAIVLSTAFWFLNRRSSWGRVFWGSLFFMMLFWVSKDLRTYTDYHPPMRLLPLFLGELFFGLNSFAFRVPGVLASAALSVFVFVLLRQFAQSRITSWTAVSVWTTALLALAISYIPPVFQSAELVEPSFWAFAFWLLALMQLWRACAIRDPESLIAAAVLVGVGALFRQTVAICWLPVGLVALFLLWKKRLTWLQLFEVALPFFFVLPYLFTAKIQGHGGLDSYLQFGAKLPEIFSSAVVWKAIYQNHMVIWLSIAILGWVVLLVRERLWIVLAILLFFPVALAAYHLPLLPGLWGVGRYQAEYVSTFVAIGMFGWLAVQRSWLQKLGVFLVLWALSWSIELNKNLSLDTAYEFWPAMRITTASSFPYDQAMAHIKVQNLPGRFVILGGSPYHLQLASWLGGFTLQEGRVWYQNQAKVQKAIAEQESFESLLATLKESGIDRLLVLGDTKREIQHRNPSAIRMVESVREMARRGQKFYLERVFGPEHGGFLELYSILK